MLDNAREEAGNFGGGVIGTEHILIAMLKEYDCVGTRLLHTLGINIQQLYLDVLKAMGKDKMIPKEDLQSGNLMKHPPEARHPPWTNTAAILPKWLQTGNWTCHRQGKGNFKDHPDPEPEKQEQPLPDR